MIASRHAPDLRSRAPGHDLARGGVRFASEIIAWTVTVLALWPHSILMAVVAIVVLIGLPAIFSTPGDRPGGDGPVAVPGIVTILLLLLHLGAAVVASWAVWPAWAAVGVTSLCLLVVITEQPRWRSLLTTSTSHGWRSGLLSRVMAHRTEQI